MTISIFFDVNLKKKLAYVYSPWWDEIWTNKQKQINDQLYYKTKLDQLVLSLGWLISWLYPAAQVTIFIVCTSKKILLSSNSFIYSNFNYCSLVWVLSSKRSLNEVENLQGRALGKRTMNPAWERLLCIEVNQTIWLSNSLNPCFM